MTGNATQFSTLLRGTMDKQGFIDFDLPIPLTTENKNERLVVALTSAHIPSVPNMGLIDKRPWKEVKREQNENDQTSDQWYRLWVYEHCEVVSEDPGDQPMTNFEKFAATNMGIEYMTTAKYTSSVEVLKYMINNFKPLIKRARGYPNAMQNRHDGKSLPASYINAADWIDLVNNGNTVSVRQKSGLNKFVYGEEGLPYFKMYLMIELSEKLQAMLKYTQRFMHLNGNNVMPFDSLELGNQRMMHLMMEGLQDTLVSGTYRPMLYTYLQGSVKHEPTHIHYVSLKDTHNSGERSERQRLRFWIEDLEGDLRRLIEERGSPAEVTLELQWRRIILTSTAQLAIGSRPEAGLGMQRMFPSLHGKD